MTLSQVASDGVPDEPDADEDLLPAFYGGDGQALELLMRRYAGYLERRVASSLPPGTCARREKAQEIVQTAWIKVMDTRGNPDARWMPERGPVRPWLLTIVDNCRRDEVRKDSRAPVVHGELPDAPDPQQEERFRHGEDSAVVVAALAKLDAELQFVLLRKFWVGDRQTDIARERGVSEATISRRCKDGCEALRAELLAAWSDEDQ